MKWGEFFRVSLEALAANKLRSLLTMLGIIIGVGAVIVMVSLGQGAKKSVADQMAALGTDLLFIRPGTTRVGPGVVRVSIGSEDRLDLTDLKRLKADCTTLKEVIPEVRGQRQVIYGNKNWNTSVIGTSPEYFAMRNFTIAAGQPFTEKDVHSIARVAVIGPRVAENLFGKSDPIGKSIRVGRIRFEVIGVTATKGVSGGWFDFDDMVVVPYTTAQKRILGRDHFDNLLAQVKDEKNMAAAFVEIERVLRRSHRLRPDQDNDFSIQSQSDFAVVRQQTTQTLTYLLAGVALVSLIVGGIGIMNIMLVSVTERTREIGIRMAIGARRRDILIQFLMESMTLAVVGGLLGIAVGILGAAGLSHLFGWSTLVALNSLALSFCFACAVGLFFGLFPARRAAMMNPIEALRYE